MTIPFNTDHKGKRTRKPENSACFVLTTALRRVSFGIR